MLKEQVYNIFQYLNNDTQVGLFSATMPYELNSLTEKFMRNPIKILVKNSQTPKGLNEQAVNELRKSGFYKSLIKNSFFSLIITSFSLNPL